MSSLFEMIISFEELGNFHVHLFFNKKHLGFRKAPYGFLTNNPTFAPIFPRVIYQVRNRQESRTRHCNTRAETLVVEEKDFRA